MGRRGKGAYALILVLLALTLIVVLLFPGLLPQGKPAGQETPGKNCTSTCPISGASRGTGVTANATANMSSNTTAGAGANMSATLKIATFNIQAFGESKRSKSDVMDVLAKTARHFDLLAIQELRDDTETTLPIFLEKINSLPGLRYGAISSPRLGRTSSKENYAFIYNTETVALVPGSNFTFEDPPAGSSTDLFQREPFIARFRSLAAPGFDFAIITIHTDPDTTPQELADLPLTLESALSRYDNETDYIMLGDMNADCSYLSAAEESGLALRNSSFAWVVPDDADTTVKSTDCAYDRIILAGTAASHYSGGWGIFHYDSEYGLNQSAAEDVSDHFPVWMDLSPAG